MLTKCQKLTITVMLLNETMIPTLFTKGMLRSPILTLLVFLEAPLISDVFRNDESDDSYVPDYVTEIEVVTEVSF